VVAFQPQFYPKDWSKIRKDALARAKGCDICRAQRGDFRRNAQTDELYIVYLAVCHRLWYTAWKQDADTIVLCQKCHNQFDAKFRKRLKLSQQTPIGKAHVYIHVDGQPILVVTARTYIELISAIDTLPTGQVFDVHLEINLAVVGNGRYQRTKAGTKRLSEHGACEDLHLVFQVIPQRMQPHRPPMAASPE